MFGHVLRLALTLWILTSSPAQGASDIGPQLRAEILGWEQSLPISTFEAGEPLAVWQQRWSTARALAQRIKQAESGGSIGPEEALSLRGHLLEALVASLRTNQRAARNLLDSAPLDLTSIWLRHQLFGLRAMDRDFLRTRHPAWTSSEKILVASLEAQQTLDAYERRSAIANLCRLLSEIQSHEIKTFEEAQELDLVGLLSSRPMCLEISNAAGMPSASLQVVTEKDLRLPVVSVLIAPGINLAIRARAFMGNSFVDLSAPDSGESLSGGSLNVDVLDGENSRRATFVSSPSFLPPENGRANRPGIFIFLVNGEAGTAR